MNPGWNSSYREWTTKSGIGHSWFNLATHCLVAIAPQICRFWPTLRVSDCLMFVMELTTNPKNILMETTTRKSVTVEATVNAPVEKVWKYWSEPDHIKKWAFASDDWHAPKAENDLRKDGTFTTTMAAKDGSFSFEFGGVYTDVQTNKLIEYVLGDGRMVKVTFSGSGNVTKVVESFDLENENSEEMQRAGWQAILDNFKKYTER